MAYSEDEVLNAVAFLNGEFLILWEQGHKTERTVKFRDAASILQSLLNEVMTLRWANDLNVHAKHEVQMLKAQLASDREVLARLRAIMLHNDAT
jgi:hypothetical protein